MLDRRSLIKGAGAGAYALGTGIGFSPLEALALDTVTLPFDNGERPLVKYPQKRPMIGLTSAAAAARDAVRGVQRGRHHAERRLLRALPPRRHPARRSIPTRSRVEVKGKVDKPLKLSLAELKRMRRRSRSSRSTSARATAAASSSRAWPAASSATARWAMRAGGACRSRTCSTRPASQPARKQVTFDGLDGPVGRQDAGLRQGARHRPRARRRGDARLRDERRRTCRCSTAFRCGWSCRATTAPTGSSTSTRSPSSTTCSTASG